MVKMLLFHEKKNVMRWDIVDITVWMVTKRIQICGW